MELVARFRRTGGEIFCRLFTIDARSLALARIGCGLIVLYDLADRGREMSLFYFSSGLIPRPVFLHDLWSWSLHTLFDADAWVLFLFATHALFALALVFGVRTRLAAVGTFILTVSLQHANVFVLFGGDTVLRVVLFAGMFLPWGKAWSYDVLRGAVAPIRSLFSGWSVVILLQIVLIYVFAVLHKAGVEWRDGSAVYYAMTSTRFGTPLGEFMASLSWLSPLLVTLTFVIQISAPILLFSPLYTTVLRTLGIALLAGLHFSFFLALNIHWFSFIMFVVLGFFIPEGTWDALARLSKRYGAWLFSKGTHEIAVRSRWQRYALIAIPIVYFVPIVWWNIGNLYITKTYNSPDFERSSVFSATMTTIGLDQYWSLFSPHPPVVQVWPVVRLEFEDGEERDALREFAPVQWDRPEHPAELYGSFRMAGYLTRLQMPRNIIVRISAVKYFCRYAEEHTGKSPLRAEIYTVSGPRHYTDPTEGPFVPRLLISKRCGT